ncbi:hypothetical protein AUJ46_06045 [Candidatus Peregrinibacteria bacterium CG1_02_54_53]|nr:MAG: hypothetical protein AUJ46_06045 [Candidatus Peregrinibacteria bacterium CG1_02_54_53]
MQPVLLCLHGWGGSKESFDELRAALDGEELTILTPDLPGFGNEPDPDRPWNVDDYADWVEDWLHKNNIEEPLLLLGHSHGGRIAIKLVARGQLPVRHLYLCAAAGIRHSSLKRTVGNVFAHIGGIILALPGLKRLRVIARTLLYKLLREHDYERASPLMQKTLAKVTAEDLTPLLSTITIPTDLFWGENDTYTPIRDGQTMHEAIRGSVLHTFTGTRHRVHRDRALEIASVIREIL